MALNPELPNSALVTGGILQLDLITTNSKTGFHSATLDTNKDPYIITANLVAEFLIYLFEVRKKSFKIIKANKLVMCSILSIIHKSLTRGENKCLDMILQSILFATPPPIKNKPPIWDLTTLLDHFKRLKSDKNLNLLKLGAKLACLIRLATSRHNCDLTHLDLRSMVWSTDKSQVKFILNSPNKVASAKTSIATYEILQTLHLTQLPIDNRQEEKICPVRCLRTYLNRTKHIRSSTALFITTIDPFKAAKNATISGWIKRTMKEAGIDIGVYAPHSLRSASVSSAYGHGVSISRILRLSGWKKESMFTQHYLKDITPKNPTTATTMTADAEEDIPPPLARPEQLMTTQQKTYYRRNLQAIRKSNKYLHFWNDTDSDASRKIEFDRLQ